MATKWILGLFWLDIFSLILTNINRTIGRIIQIEGEDYKDDYTHLGEQMVLLIPERQSRFRQDVNSDCRTFNEFGSSLPFDKYKIVCHENT